MEVKGRDLSAGLPKTLTIRSEEIREALQEPLSSILESVRITLERCPPELAADLVRRPVAVLVSVGGATAALAAKKATSTIPILFVIGGDPVALGLSSSLSRPDSNATGMTIISADLAQKRLGLLRELVPKASAFAALVNPNTPEGRVQRSDMRAAAESLGLNLRILEAGEAKGIESAFATLAQDKVDALLVESEQFRAAGEREKLLVESEKLRKAASILAIAASAAAASFGK